MLAAAKAAAVKLTPEELERDSILPQVDRIRCLRLVLALPTVRMLPCMSLAFWHAPALQACSMTLAQTAVQFMTERRRNEQHMFLLRDCGLW